MIIILREQSWVVFHKLRTITSVVVGGCGGGCGAGGGITPKASPPGKQSSIASASRACWSEPVSIL